MRWLRYYLLLIILLWLPQWHTLWGKNQNISQGEVYDGEPYIAINPLDPHHLVVAWMSYVDSVNKVCIKTKVSFDGGRTWSSAITIPHTHSSYRSADPSLDFDISGNVYLSFVDYNPDSREGAVFIVKSSDGGLTWGEPVEVINANDDVQKPIDRPWISIDRSNGPDGGNIYITTIPPRVFGYVPPPYHPYVSISRDGGNKFEWRYLDTLNWLAGDIIRQPMALSCVSSDGIFHAAYPSYKPSEDPFIRYIHASSSDGGRSFSYHTILRASSGLKDSLVKSGHIILSDPSEPEHLVFVYLDRIYGDIDVFLKESFDGGETWGEAIRVNDDPVGNDRIQDLMWADFDRDGDLVVTWRDRRNGEDSTYQTSYEIWGAFRKKGSQEFSNNFRISDTIIEYNPILGYSGNDFMCVKLMDDTLYAVWGDTRSGKLEIWFERMPVNGDTEGISIKLLHSERTPSVNFIEDIVSPSIRVEGDGIREILIYDTMGRIVAEYEDVNLINVEHLSPGTYIIKIITEEGDVLKRVLTRL